MRSNINLIVIEGRLTNNPILSRTKAGKIVCKFSVDNNRYYFQGKNLVDEISSFQITAYGPLAERCASTLKRGNPVLVSGHLKQRTQQTNTCDKRIEVSIVAANVKFLGRRADVNE